MSDLHWQPVKRSRLRAVGLSLCAAGALLLSFVAYQLWGTALSEHAAQGHLRSEFERQLHGRTDGTATTSTPRRTSGSSDSDTFGSPAAGTAGDDVPDGDPVGFLTIPRLGMNDDVIVEGVDDADLRQGPGHYPGTPLPGQPGNAAIAGHRTTYAAPFYNLNELVPGDPIIVETLAGTFRYDVSETETVAPTDSAVLDDSSSTSELTLTTCTPRYSSAQRLVVVAVLQNPPKRPTPTTTTVPRSGRPLAAAGDLGAGAGGSGVSGVVGWGLLTAVLAGGAFFLWRRPRRFSPRWLTAVVGTPLVVLNLFLFYGHLSSLLPASF